MVPVEIEINIRNRPPDVLRASGEKPLELKTYPPAPLEITSINNDGTGVFSVKGRTEVVRVKKHTSERDKVGSEADTTSPIFVSGTEFLIVSSPLYDETLRISHKRANYSHYGFTPPPPPSRT